MDKNQDGILSADEVERPQIFNQMDKNGDGFVTPAEAREYYRTRTDRQPSPTAPRASDVSPQNVNALPGPAPATPPMAASRAFTELRFTRDGQPGAKDDRRQWISGTETMRFLQHQGKLFVSTGVWMDVPYFQGKGGQPWTGPQILAKESAQSSWCVDMSFPLAIRVDAMISATLSADGSGRKLDPPVTMLIASSSSENTATWTRDDSTGKWTESLARGGLRGGLRSFYTHLDAVTKVQYLFGGSTKSGSIFGAVYDAATPGHIRWHETPELFGTGRVMCMAGKRGHPLFLSSLMGVPMHHFHSHILRHDGCPRFRPARRNPSGGVSPCAATLEENTMKPMPSPFSDSEFGEGAILSYLEHEMPGYRFEAHVDAPFVRELLSDFPETVILDEIKNFRWYHDNAPLPGAGPQHLSIRRWSARAASRSRYCIYIVSSGNCRMHTFCIYEARTRVVSWHGCN